MASSFSFMVLRGELPNWVPVVRESYTTDLRGEIYPAPSALYSTRVPEETRVVACTGQITGHRPSYMTREALAEKQVATSAIRCTRRIPS